MNINDYLASILIKKRMDNKKLFIYKKICEISNLYFEYLSDEDKKAYIKIFGFHPLKLKEWINKKNIYNYSKLNYFLFLVVLQYLILRDCLRLYHSNKKTIEEYEKIMTNGIKKNKMKNKINTFLNRKELNKNELIQKIKFLENEKKELVKLINEYKESIDEKNKNLKKLRIVNEMFDVYSDKLKKYNISHFI